MNDVTKILHAIEDGDPSAATNLLPLVYEELRLLARAKLANEPSARSLQPTLLVHEAYLRLIDSNDQPHWNGRGHFFGAAAEAMRRILVENARRRQSQKRGGCWQRMPLDRLPPETDQDPTELLDLDEALREFEQTWPTQAELVKLRYFAGLTIAEASRAMNISSSSAERYWAFAKSWLYARLNEGFSSDISGNS